MPKLIEDVFGDGSVKLISVREVGIDLETPTGRAMAQLLNTSNALICDIGSQICKDALQRRRKAGYPVQPPMGWRWKAEKNPNGRRGIEPNPEKAEVVKFIIRELLSARGGRVVARELMARGIKTARGMPHWYKNIVLAIAQQPHHYGLVHVGDGECVRGAHFDQRFFEPEDLDRVKQLIKRRAAEPLQLESQPDFLLGGKADCDYCGAKMRSRRGQGRFRIYACQAETWQQTEHCQGNSCRADWAEQEVEEHIRSYLARPDVIREARRQAGVLLSQDHDQSRRKQRRLESEIEKLRQDALRWAKRLNDEDITVEEFREYKQELEQSREVAQAALRAVGAQLQEQGRGDRDWAEIERALADAASLWDQMTAADRKRLVDEIIETVRIRRQPDGTIEVKVKPRLQPERIITIPSFRGQALTKRQMEALWLVGHGHTRKQAAKQLGVDVRAVSAALLNARHRLGMDTMPEAMENALPLIAPFVKWLDLEGRSNRKTGHGRRWPALTTEETRVLRLLAADNKGPAIARELGIEPSTVYVHLHNMRNKVGAGNNAQLLSFAKEAGLLAEAPATG